MAKANRAGSSPGVVTQTFTLPQPEEEPNTNDRQLSFWEQVSAVPDHLWWDGGERGKGYRIYCYDEEGPSQYFGILHEAIDLEWVRRNWGGGIYKLTLNDVENKFATSTKFRIEGESRRKKPPTNVQSAPGVAVPPAESAMIGQILGPILSMMEENNRQQREMMMQFLTRGHAAPGVATVDPTSQFEGMLKLVTTLLPALIPKQENPIEMLLKLKELMGQPKDPFADLLRLKELGLINTNGGGGAGNLLEQLEVITTVAEKIGLTGGGAKSIPEMLIAAAPDVVSKVVEGVKEYRIMEERRNDTAKIAERLQARQVSTVVALQQPAPAPVSGVPPRTPAGQAPGQTHGTASPDTASGMGQAQGPATQLEVQPIGDAEAPDQPIEENAMQPITEQEVNEVKKKLMTSVAQGETGEQIYAWLDEEAPWFVDQLCVFEGKTNRVVGIAPLDQLAQLCALDPILQKAVPLPRFRETLKQLLSAIAVDNGLPPQ